MGKKPYHSVHSKGTLPRRVDSSPRYGDVLGTFTEKMKRGVLSLDYVNASAEALKDDSRLIALRLSRLNNGESYEEIEADLNR